MLLVISRHFSVQNVSLFYRSYYFTLCVLNFGSVCVRVFLSCVCVRVQRGVYS